MGSPRRLKMERLSPIAPPSQITLGHNLSCYESPTDSLRQHEDYAIEAIGSPEVAKFPMTLSDRTKRKRRRSSNSTAKKTSKQPWTTPLSGLVTKKAVTLPRCSTRAETLSDRLPTIAEASVDDGGELLSIGTFSSPGQSNIVDRERHLEPVAPKLAFCQQLNVSTTSPLPNVKEARSDDAEFTEDIGDMCENIEGDGIECFESPAKCQPGTSKATVDIFNLSGLDLRSSFVGERSQTASVDEVSKSRTDLEACGIVRKKRKRALNFGSSKVNEGFVVPTVESVAGGVAKQTVGSTEESSGPQFNEVKSRLTGFIVSSSLACDSDEEVIPVAPSDEIIGESANENSPQKGVPFFVIHHESSSDDSTVVDVQFNESNDSNSTILPDSNIKRAIQSFTTPSKDLKIFSEAVAIGDFGSPTPRYSVPIIPVESVEDDRLEVQPSQEEEFVDESEQVRPLKRRKRGSLIERAGSVIGRIDASNSLFDYELKAGLRPLKGKLVSSSLVVCKKWVSDGSSVFLVCKMLSRCSELSDPAQTPLVVMVAKKIPNELTDGSVVLLHFPVYVIYCESLKLPYVLADNQLVLHPTEPKIENPRHLEIGSVNIPKSNPISFSKVIATNIVRTLLELSLAQNLVEDVTFTLLILHVARFDKKVGVLCRDEERQYCWVELSNERDVRRATALESLHILKRGSLVEVKAFHVTSVDPPKETVRNLIKYCSSGELVEKLFTLSPAQQSWIISSSGGSKHLARTPTPICKILSEQEEGKRYFVEVHSVEISNTKVFIQDKNGHAIPYDNRATSCGSSVPFFLDAAYFSCGKLCSDDYTKVITNKTLD